MLDAVITNASERAALVCTRSLGRAGLRVGTYEAWPAPAFRSRWSAASGIVPDYTRPHDLVDALLAIVDEQRARVLLPTHDGTVEALRARRQEVEARVGLALAPEAALDVAVDKGRTLALAAELGLAVPRMVRVETVDELTRAIEEIGFPLVVKPLQSWVSRPGVCDRMRSVLAVDVAETRAAVELAAAAETPVLVQEWAPGRREAVSLFRAEGRIWGRFAQVAHRMYPPLGGASVVRESIPLPRDATEGAEALVSAAGLDGYSEVEFRYGADGRPLLMEINPRVSASLEIAVRSGVDFPSLIYRWAAGLPLEEAASYRVGLRMRWLGGDLRWLYATHSSRPGPDILSTPRALARFAGEFLRPAAYDYVTISDLRPAVTAATDFVLRGVTRRQHRLTPPAEPRAV